MWHHCIELISPYTCILLNSIFSENWIPVTHNELLSFDLENEMLQIKTNTEQGSDERVKVRLYSASTTNYEDDSSSFLTIMIKFQDPIKYSIRPCNATSQAFLSLPEGREKTWGIQKTGDNILVFCNGELVLEYSIPVDHECYGIFKELLKQIFFVKLDNGANDNASLAYKASPMHGNIPLLLYYSVIVTLF